MNRTFQRGDNRSLRNPVAALDLDVSDLVQGGKAWGRDLS